MPMPRWPPEDLMRPMCTESARMSIQGSGRTFRHSAAHGLRYFELSRLTNGFFCHRCLRGPNANLTPAPGRQDHHDFAVRSHTVR